MRHAVAAVACVLLAGPLRPRERRPRRGSGFLELQPRLVVLLGQLAGFDPRHSTLQVLAVGRGGARAEIDFIRECLNSRPGS